MYWWHKAASAVEAGTAQRFGFITTNSIVQDYSRPVLEKHICAGSVKLSFAIADHPWVEAHDGAAVRVAMTVGAPGSFGSSPVLGKVTAEGGGDDHVIVQLTQVEPINQSLTAGTSARGRTALESNSGMCFQGVVPGNEGFKLDADAVTRLGFDVAKLPPTIKPYLIGRDLVRERKERFIIDLFGLTEQEARAKWPALYQHLRDRVYPERLHNRRDTYREKWWIFCEPRPAMRKALNIGQYRRCWPRPITVLVRVPGSDSEATAGPARSHIHDPRTLDHQGRSPPA